MANLPESSNWDSGVYQIETTDSVVGGVNGISNAQAKALANRTKWLRDWVESGNTFLARLLAVDGAGSGLDADKLDGLDSVEFLRSAITGTDWNVVDATHAKLISAADNGPVAGTSYIGLSIANAGGGAYAQQIAARNGVIYYRSQENGAWGAWNKLWHANNDGAGSGLDADLVRGLPADFTASLAANGYQKFPSGLLLQWGEDTVTHAESGGSVSVTFPVAFPTACRQILLTPRNPSSLNNNGSLASYVSKSLTGFFWRPEYTGAGTDQIDGVNWLAIGC